MQRRCAALLMFAVSKLISVPIRFAEDMLVARDANFIIDGKFNKVRAKFFLVPRIPHIHAHAKIF